MKKNDYYLKVWVYPALNFFIKIWLLMMVLWGLGFICFQYIDVNSSTFQDTANLFPKDFTSLMIGFYSSAVSGILKVTQMSIFLTFLATLSEMSKFDR